MTRIPLEPGVCYHIYNHAVGKDKIFCEEENYLFFLRKFSHYMVPYVDILAYCLMPNHFHFVLRIKEKEHLARLWEEKLSEKKKQREIKNLPLLKEGELYDGLITTQFANFFNSYVQSYNKKYSRMGSLLKESFQRKKINGMDYLIKVICYVHNNPIEHGFTIKKENWKYSSYNAIVLDGKTKVQKEDVVEVFGGKENFIFAHRKEV